MNQTSLLSYITLGDRHTSERMKCRTSSFQGSYLLYHMDYQFEDVRVLSHDRPRTSRYNLCIYFTQSMSFIFLHNSMNVTGVPSRSVHRLLKC